MNKCKHYDKELDCCAILSDWRDPMPILQPCVESPCNKYEVKTQFERIKGMNLEQMAEFIELNMLKLEGGEIKNYHKCEYVIMCGYCVNSAECVKSWLESEVEE